MLAPEGPACFHEFAVTKRTLTWLVAALSMSSTSFAQNGRAVGGEMPVAPAAPPQGSIGVMPQQSLGVNSRTMRGDRVRTQRRPEEYGGVAPGSAQPPPGMRRLSRRRNPGLMVAWPGFQLLPTHGSRVFVVATAGTQMLEGPRGPTQRTYIFPGARLFLHNNSRPLETVAFPTPLVRARLVRARGAVQLVLELRADVTPTVSQGTLSDGLIFYYLDFPTYTVEEIARIRLSNGLEVSATPQGAVIPPSSASPVVDNERPPPVVR